MRAELYHEVQPSMKQAVSIKKVAQTSDCRCLSDAKRRKVNRMHPSNISKSEYRATTALITPPSHDLPACRPQHRTSSSSSRPQKLLSLGIASQGIRQHFVSATGTDTPGRSIGSHASTQLSPQSYIDDSGKLSLIPCLYLLYRTMFVLD